MTIIYSDWVSLNLTTEAVPSIGVPTNFTAQVLGAFSARLSWDLVIGADGYQLERSLTEGFDDVTLVYEGVETFFTDSDLESETQYFYRLRSKKTI